MIQTVLNTHQAKATMTEFDKAVKVLRGTVEPRFIPKKKADCTPEEWAAHLDYALHWARVRRRRIKKQLARAKASKTAPQQAAKPAAKPATKTPSAVTMLASVAIDTGKPEILEAAKRLAGTNHDAVGLLNLIGTLLS